MSSPDRVDSSQLFLHFLESNPNISDIIGCPKSELDSLRGFLRAGLTGFPLKWTSKEDPGKLMVPSEGEWGFLLGNHPEKQVYDLQVYGLDGYKRRIVMIGTGALNEGNDKALAMASQIGEKSPLFGLKPQESWWGRLLNKIGRATTYEVVPEGDKYNLTIHRPSQPVSQEVRQEVKKRFTHGTASFWVVARVNSPESQPKP